MGLAGLFSYVLWDTFVKKESQHGHVYYKKSGKRNETNGFKNKVRVLYNFKSEEREIFIYTKRCITMNIG